MSIRTSSACGHGQHSKRDGSESRVGRRQAGSVQVLLGSGLELATAAEVTLRWRLTHRGSVRLVLVRRQAGAQGLGRRR